MRRLRVTISHSAMLAIACVALSGCGDSKPSASSEEPAAGSSDKWLDAGNVELVYDAQIRMDAINNGEDQFAADKSCEAMLPMAKKALSDSSDVGTDVQIMYKTCADAGLKFENDIRCHAGRLQVLCR